MRIGQRLVVCGIWGNLTEFFARTRGLIKFLMSSCGQLILTVAHDSCRAALEMRSGQMCYKRIDTLDGA